MSASGACLTIILTCIVVVAYVESLSLRRHQGHHSRPQYAHDFEEPMSLDLLPKHALEGSEDRPRHHEDHRQRERRGGGGGGYLRDQTFSSSEYEDVEEQEQPVAAHRCRHASKSEDEGVRKIHNKHNIFRRLTKDRARQLEIQHEKQIKKYYELEVSKAQNSTLCKYTVVPVPDPTGTRTPKNLEHVKCTHVGSKCLDNSSTHCCIQTYKKIDVSYGDGSGETIKLYVGCVCAYQMLLEEPTFSN